MYIRISNYAVAETNYPTQCVFYNLLGVKETEIEKQLKEEQKILESIAEKKGEKLPI